MTAVDVCIVSFNTRDVLRRCLKSIERASPGVVVVVDNASTDGSREMVAAEFPGIVLLANRLNVGYGAAVNQAVRRCRAPYLLVLNSDTQLQPDALTALARYLDHHPEAAVVGPRLIHADGRLQPSCYSWPTPFELLVDFGNLAGLIRRAPALGSRVLRTRAHSVARVVPWVSGAAMAVRRDAFEAVGGFDESFFMYYEEVDLCFRLAKAGWRVHFAPVTNVAHIGGVSTRARRDDMALRFFASLEHFYARHLTAWQARQMRAVVCVIALTRLARDLVRQVATRDAARKAELQQDVRLWHRVLRGDWQTLAPTVRAAAGN